MPIEKPKGPDTTPQENKEWQHIFQEVQFKSPLLQDFPALMQEFLNGDGAVLENEFKHAIELTQKLAPSEAQELYKSLVLGCVFTQNVYHWDNEVGIDVVEHPRRLHETIQWNGKEIHPPAFIHPLRAYIRALEMGTHPVLTKAAPIHDIGEDARMVIEGTEVTGNKIFDLIREEFTDGNKVALLVESVSKYRVIPGDIKATIKEHFLYKAILNYVTGYLERTGQDPSKIERYEDSILKAISTIVKLQMTLLDGTQSEEEYLQMLAQAFTLKCIDINDNLASPGTKPAILLRDRMFATIARLMHSPLADEILSNMARHYKDDPMLSNSNLLSVVEALSKQEQERYKTESIQFLKDTFGLSCEDKKMQVGLRIPFRDEGDTTIAPQILVRCTKQEIETACSRFGTENSIEVLSKLLNGNKEEILMLKSFNGVIENIVNILGRDGVMIEVQQDGKTKLYIRIVQNKPTFAEYALRNYNIRRKAPEAKLFSKIFIDPKDPKSRVKSILNSRAALTFDPHSLLLDPSIAIYVSPRGVLSCDVNTEREKVCRRLKLKATEQKCKPTQIMTGEPAHLEDPNELHIYSLV